MEYFRPTCNTIKGPGSLNRKGSMHKNPMEITDADYTRFWQDNIQKLEEISGNLDILVNNLELEYSHFESIYSKIELDIDILS